MTDFRLFTSNRMEVLATALGEMLRAPLSSPFAQEVYVVQSAGMARWLSMLLADDHGIFANGIFYYPNAFVNTVLEGAPQTRTVTSAYETEIMTWRILDLLPNLLPSPGFETLHRYLGADVSGLKAYQLSVRIADLFDQYLLFRPDMIFQWEAGHDSHWQAVLWRALIAKTADSHRPALLSRFHAALAGSRTDAYQLPERVTVFGISALPRFHMDVLAAVAEVADVYLFVMNPCREYWGDILDKKGLRRTTAKADAADISREMLHLSQNNRLLAGFGAQGRDFLSLLQSYPLTEHPLFVSPGEGTLLHMLQSDVLNLVESPNRPVADDDDSVMIHSCHSQLREVEILKDHMLAWFDADPDLRPGDILVMMPDIETYAPYIQAVFDAPEDSRQYIPYSIADRSIPAESRVIDTFLAFLDLADSRFAAAEIIGLLETDVVRNRFDISASDYRLLLKWIQETRIRWGRNAGHRAELDLPPTSENTWQAGLDRMLLGYAMAGGETRLFTGILPYDDIEGEAAPALGRFCEFYERLCAFAKSLKTPRTLSAWSEYLIDVLDDFFMPDDACEREFGELRDALGCIADHGQIAGYTRPVIFDVLRQHLKDDFDRKGFGFGFITGGVTFCAMLPMRSIPFHTICLLGMNNTDYPREQRALGFDLIARHPRPGDRSRRHDDQYLFLEALLSARRRLHISYIGQSARDNSESPPSVLVSDLMDLIADCFHETASDDIHGRIHKHHYLQPFYPGYFETGKASSDSGVFFSYSETHARGASMLAGPKPERRPFFTRPLPDTKPVAPTLTLADICDYYKHPSRYLLGQRLGVKYATSATITEDAETFELDPLTRYQLRQQLVAVKRRGGNPSDLRSVVRASGILPHQDAGDWLFDCLAVDAAVFAENLSGLCGDATPGPVPVDLLLADERVTGTLADVFPHRMVMHRYAVCKASDLIGAWIHHLALNCLENSAYPDVSIYAALKPLSRPAAMHVWEFAPVKDCRKILSGLISFYREGMRLPLHFFPRTSMVYAEARVRSNLAPAAALEKARRIWSGDDYNPGEGGDDYYRRCFDVTDPLDAAFEAIAMTVFEPLLAHVKARPL